MAKILVIDDEPGVARAIGRMLWGHETSVETDPRIAVERIGRREHFDLILCDLQMPGLTGREVYQAVKRAYVSPPLMLIMSGELNVKPLYAAGCAVLFKPFSETELRSLVSALLHDDIQGSPTAAV